jgi:2-polyprenyl-3-methyl-5-hydroxy-6-metoxy-1,4-benzoquinol methylase
VSPRTDELCLTHVKARNAIPISSEFISGEDEPMSFQFNLAYFFGYAPWDRWGGKPLRQLRELFEGPKAIAPGRVLDLGCGMGRATIYLAQLGWKATGIDAGGRALRVARRRAATAGVDVEFVEGDITQLDRGRNCRTIRPVPRPRLLSYPVGPRAPPVRREHCARRHG